MRPVGRMLGKVEIGKHTTEELFRRLANRRGSRGDRSGSGISPLLLRRALGVDGMVVGRGHPREILEMADRLHYIHGGGRLPFLDGLLLFLAASAFRKGETAGGAYEHATGDTWNVIVSRHFRETAADSARVTRANLRRNESNDARGHRYIRCGGIHLFGDPLQVSSIMAGTPVED